MKKITSRLCDAKHRVVVTELANAVPSPVTIVLADAILEEKAKQYNEIFEMQRSAIALLKAQDDFYRPRGKRRRLGSY